MCDQAINGPKQVSMPQLCSLTKRAMVISPQPERVSDLLASLSAACFDLFCLHELDESLLGSLQPELIIYDALPFIAGEAFNLPEQKQTLLRNVVGTGIPLVVLLDEHMHSRREELDLNGSELLIWPSSVEETMNHIQKLLEKQASPVQLQDMLLYKDLKVDLKRMIVMQEDRRIDLTKTEYDLLVHFLSSDGSVQSRELLLDVIWGLHFYTSSNVVDVHIKSLRKKLEDSAVDPKYIVTVRSAGYRLAD